MALYDFINNLNIEAAVAAATKDSEVETTLHSIIDGVFGGAEEIKINDFRSFKTKASSKSTDNEQQSKKTKAASEESAKKAAFSDLLRTLHAEAEKRAESEEINKDTSKGVNKKAASKEASSSDDTTTESTSTGNSDLSEAAWPEFLKTLHSAADAENQMKTESGIKRIAKICKDAVMGVVKYIPEFSAKAKALKGDEYAYLPIPFIKDKKKLSEAKQFNNSLNRDIDPTRKVNGIPLWAAMMDAGYADYSAEIHEEEDNRYRIMVRDVDDNTHVKTIHVINGKFYYVTNP